MSVGLRRLSTVRNHTAPSIRFPSSGTGSPAPAAAPVGTTTTSMNMFQAINSAMDIALSSNPKCYLFGEDVGFGGVFRCSMGLRDKFGPHRVFNTPLSEQGIAAFAIGLCAQDPQQVQAIAEIQFADYIFPAFDQIVNEMAKYRYRTSSHYHVGGVTIRAPYGAVGHGGLYHSQSVESFFAHCAGGLVVVIPRGPIQAKGLLLSSIRRPDPVIFLEPKSLYRASVDENVPIGDYTFPIGKAESVWQQQSDDGDDHVLIIAYGSQVYRAIEAAKLAKTESNINCHVVDLQTIVPWDKPFICELACKIGRVIITHEAPYINGFASEIAATIQAECFLNLKAPVSRVCGFDTPFPLAWEEFYLPNKYRILDEIKNIANY